MKIIDVNEENFEDVVLKNKKRVLVDFNADWCGPCKMLRPILDEFAKDNDKVEVASVNIDNNENLAKEYGVMSIPCLVLFEDGKEINRNVGLMPKDKIEEFVNYV